MMASELACLIDPNGTLRPFSREDAEELASYSEGQLVRVQVQGIRKSRSYQQLKLFRACCRTVADQTGDPKWDHAEKVIVNVKALLGFFKTGKDGMPLTVSMTETCPKCQHRRDAVRFLLGSVSYKELRHMEACHFFERAFDLMAKHLKVSVEALVGHAEY